LRGVGRLISWLIVLALLAPSLAEAFEARAVRESDGARAMSGCALSINTNGTAANYRWYNLCSGYIWIGTSFVNREGAGVLFGGSEQPEVNDTNRMKRVITYWRNVVPGYNQTIDIFVDLDNEGDGCPDLSWQSDLALDPSLRWNCSDFGVPIPSGHEYVIVRFQFGSGAAPTFVTDGAYSAGCDPEGTPRSFYYGINGSACVPWIGPTGRADNFLHWLVLDVDQPPPPNVVQRDSWGAVKKLFR
jgi:hypothetical protein